MKLIADANILFSIAKKDSVTNKLIKEKDLELIAPDYALKELNKYSSLIEEKFNINFKNYITQLKEKVKFLPISEYKDSLKEAKNIINDEKDIIYFAMALELNIPIWSNDSEFKNQKQILVFNTKELILLL